MEDFATEIICCQQNQTLYPSFQSDIRKENSCESNLSSSDLGSEFGSTPKILSLNSSFTYGSDYKWSEVPINKKNLFAEMASDSENSSDSEYKFYTPKRASSLKTCRTPPGTPKSKAVRFADALGLDLEDIRHVFNLDLPPNIPASARQDLNLGNELDIETTQEDALQLVPNFAQPGAVCDFLRRVRMHNVSLENAYINKNVLSGTVRVMNITFDKKITIRVTFDEWMSHVDFVASYVQDSYDGVTDRFSFSVLLPISCQTYGHRIQMAICYECSNGAQYWDNNFGQNYVYSCVCDSQSSLEYR